MHIILYDSKSTDLSTVRMADAQRIEEIPTSEAEEQGMHVDGNTEDRNIGKLNDK